MSWITACYQKQKIDAIIKLSEGVRYQIFQRAKTSLGQIVDVAIDKSFASLLSSCGDLQLEMDEERTDVSEAWVGWP